MAFLKSIQSLRSCWPGGIAARLNAIVALALAAVLVLATASLHFSRVAVEAAATLDAAGSGGLVEILEMDAALERHQRLIEALVRDGTAAAGGAGAEDLRRQIDRMERRMETDIQRSSEVPLDRLHALMPRFKETSAALLASVDINATETPARLRDYTEAASALHVALRQVRREVAKAMTVRVQRLTAGATRLADWVGVTALIALVLIGPVSLVLLRRATRRLRVITRSMVQLSQNNLDAPAAVRRLAYADGPDEIGDMARALSVFHSNALALRDHRGRLEQVNLWLDVALNNMQRGLAMFDARERLVIANANYRRMYDLPVDLTMHGTPLAEILTHREHTGTPDTAHLLADYRAAIEVGSQAAFERDLPDGRIFCISLTPLPGGGWVTTHEDVTAERQAEARARLLARQDSLTELQNRRGFSESLDALVRALPVDGAADHDAARFAILAIDLDHFKEINDTCGHAAGDALLVAVAQRLRGALRRGDIVARMGGDEFAIIQRGISNSAETVALAARLLPLIAEPYVIEGHSHVVGASIGMAQAPADGRTAELLLQRADVALYRAKSNGRSSAVAFDDALEAPLRARRDLERDFRAALAQQQFLLHFQPIVSLHMRSVVSCEALLRWPRADGTFVPPVEFIPLAEAAGLIVPLGAWALAEACRVAATWPDTIKVAVNLSPLQFVGTTLLSHVRAALAASGLPPHRLELEITESTLLADNASTLETLHALRAMGVAIALDDFGTGYSSLSYLRAFPFDKIKIDRSFVRDMSDRDDCVAIVKAVAALAASLDMTTVAEGVETHDHLVRVHLAGCTAVQGYLFSRPVPAAALAEVFGSCAELLAA